mgnify:CR=1 FL=1
MNANLNQRNECIFSNKMLKNSKMNEKKLTSFVYVCNFKEEAGDDPASLTWFYPLIFSFTK